MNRRDDRSGERRYKSEQDDQGQPDGELETYLNKMIGTKPKQEIIYIHKDEIEIEYDQEQVAQVLEAFQRIMIKNYSRTGFVRLTGFSNLVKLKDIQASLALKYVTVQGTIVRQSQTKAQVRDLAFECCSCQKSVFVELQQGKYKV
jgi:DNA replicative helicase MCM subunit Mcm2 (Cdc46/Mcm family)